MLAKQRLITIAFVASIVLLILVGLWVAYDIGWHIGWSQRHQIEVEIMDAQNGSKTLK